MIPGKYNFGTYITEDTVKARVFTITRTVDEVVSPEDFTDAEIKFTIRSSEGDVVHEAEIGDGISVSANEITLEAFYAPKTAGTFNHDIEITTAASERFTYIKGTIVTQLGVTRD